MIAEGGFWVSESIDYQLIPKFTAISALKKKIPIPAEGRFQTQKDA
ncbi:MAG: hypothetical protein RIS64_11 [Bacteroidota bacterium]|jgi:hypothetical protein